MDIIKSYLDSMFMKFDATEDVLKAKQELLSMMEDKYNELIADGCSENEAVGQVIMEFGNIDELSESIESKNCIDNSSNDVEKDSAYYENLPRIDVERVASYLGFKKLHAIFTGFAIFLIINSVDFTILTDLNINDGIAVSFMFFLVAIGVVMLVIINILGASYSDFNEPYVLSSKAKSYIIEMRDSSKVINAILFALGIGLCIISVTPIFFLTELFKERFEVFGVIAMFLIVGIGVFLIVYSSMYRYSLNQLLTEKQIQKENSEYKNKFVAGIMAVYWPTVTCIYLAVSFLTFNWGRTWIIWVLAALGNIIIDNIFEKKDK